MKNTRYIWVLFALLFPGCLGPARSQRTIHLRTLSPLDQVLEVGGTAQFRVSTSANETTFQWLFGCERITNATKNILTIPNITTNSAGYYTCVAYRGLDMEVSQPMQLI